MLTKFFVLVVLAAFGWIVVGGSSQQLDAPSSPRHVDALPTVSTVAARQAPTLEVRQDPVPLVRPYPVPFAGYVEPATDRQASADAPSINSEPQSQAQEKLDRDAARLAAEADGYKRVSIVGKADNGAWRAKGYRGPTEVLLTVDDTGRVSME